MAKLTPQELGTQAAERVARGESAAKFWDWKDRLSPDEWVQARQAYVARSEEQGFLLAAASSSPTVYGSRTEREELAEYYDNIDTSEHVENGIVETDD